MKTSLALLACLSAVPATASAQSGLLTFNGEVVTYTCTVSANGATGADATVALDKVAARSLAAAGTRAALKQFDVIVGSAAQPCAAAAVSARWKGDGATVNPMSGRLRNAPGVGMATGVEVSLLNDRQQDIDVRDNRNSQQVPISNGVGTLQYYGEYYGTGGLSEGLVSTRVEYELDYR